MALSSRIGVAQQNLHAALVARNILDAQGNKTPIDLGWPQKGPVAPEHVWIAGTADDWQQEWETTGDVATSAREERFGISINVMVTEKDDWAAASNRCLALLAEIEDQVRDDDKLGNAVFQSEFVGRQFSEGWTEDSRQAHGVVTIRCVAYLSG